MMTSQRGHTNGKQHSQRMRLDLHCFTPCIRSHEILAPLLIACVILILSGCQYSGATPPARSGAKPSSFVFFPGTTYQSVDGGAHWTLVDSLLLPTATGHKLPDATGYEATAISPTTRWEAASTTDGTSSIVTVARTGDGGHIWHQVKLPTFAQPNARPVALQFLDATHGWLEVDVSQSNARHGLLFSTQDGGATWTSTPLPFSGSISFTSPTAGWLLGSQWATVAGNTLARTNDGGKTWTTQLLLLPEGILPVFTAMGQPIFFDQQNGIVPVNIRQSTVIYATHNGGTSWAQTAALELAAGDFQAQPFGEGFDRSAWVTVGSNLFVTHDAGATWETVKPDTNLLGAELIVQSDTTAYALTGKGSCASGRSTGECTNTSTIQGTTDGGHTWATLWTHTYQHP